MNGQKGPNIQMSLQYPDHQCSHNKNTDSLIQCCDDASAWTCNLAIVLCRNAFQGIPTVYHSMWEHHRRVIFVQRLPGVGTYWKINYTGYQGDFNTVFYCKGPLALPAIPGLRVYRRPYCRSAKIYRRCGIAQQYICIDLRYLQLGLLSFVNFEISVMEFSVF